MQSHAEVPGRHEFWGTLFNPLHLPKVIQLVNGTTLKSSCNTVFLHIQTLCTQCQLFLGNHQVTQHIEFTENLNACFRKESVLHFSSSTNNLKNATSPFLFTQHCFGTSGFQSVGQNNLANTFGSLSFLYFISFSPGYLITALLHKHPGLSCIKIFL